LLFSTEPAKERERAVRTPALILPEAQRFMKSQKEVTANLFAGSDGNLGDFASLMRDWIVGIRRSFLRYLANIMAHGYNKEGFIQEKELWIFKFDEEYVLPLIRQQVQLSRVAIGKRVKVKNNTQCTPSRDTFVPHQKHTTPVGETTDNPMLVAVAAATDKEVKGKHNTQHVTPPTKLAPERISTFLLQNKPLRNKKNTKGKTVLDKHDSSSQHV